MPTITGQIAKLIGKLQSPIQYHLPVGGHEIALNDVIGNEFSLTYLNEISCIQCQRKTVKSFQQGYCYPCYKKLLECNLCIIHPEKCNYPHQECPDTWEHSHCKQSHVVYLANSSGLKVGITRETQIPTRWIDQGASQAIPVFKVQNRHHSGKIEVLFKKFVADKTNWRKMLGQEIEKLDMYQVKSHLLEQAKEALREAGEQFQIEGLDMPCIDLHYPVQSSPEKLSTLSFEKTTTISGKLLGIKGQYLLFEKGVLNIRKYSGYHLAVTF